MRKTTDQGLSGTMSKTAQETTGEGLLQTISGTAYRTMYDTTVYAMR